MCCHLSMKVFFSLLVYFSEKAVATHSSTLAWKIPWTEEPGRLQSMGSLRVGHNWATSLFTFQYSCLENPRDRGAWCPDIYRVVQSRTQLKRLSNSSIPAIDYILQATSWWAKSWQKKNSGYHWLMSCNPTSSALGYKGGTKKKQVAPDS